MALNSKIKSVFQNDPIFTTILDQNAFSFNWMKSEGNCLVTSVQFIYVDTMCSFCVDISFDVKLGQLADLNKANFCGRDPFLEGGGVEDQTA